MTDGPLAKLRNRLHPRYAAAVQRRFARLYYERAETTWKNTSWLGVPVWKNPADLWIYQELLFRVRPDLVIETGTAFGGSALFIASVCDLIGRGHVVTIDLNPHPDRPLHPRIEYLVDSSTAPTVVELMAKRAREAETVMVILDSDHSREHVLAELAAYGPLITAGSYLVVEDTNVNGHPVYADHGPGPMEALLEWNPTRHGFVVDDEPEKFLHTFNPRGFLRRT